MEKNGYNHSLDARNKKERRRAKWAVFAFFLPMICMPTVGLLGHHHVVDLHEGGLDERKSHYDAIFRSQDKKGILMDSLTTSLYELRNQEDMNFYQHREAQKRVKKIIKGIDEIHPKLPDTDSLNLRPIPAIYDSLYAEIDMIQFTHDSIRICRDKIKNQRFQLKECLTPGRKKKGKASSSP